MFCFQAFSHVIEKVPGALGRLVAIEGDISKPGLGISEEDTKSITECVSVVFHLAATIRFNEQLRKSLQFNVLGVREVIRLSRKMKKLEV